MISGAHWFPLRSGVNGYITAPTYKKQREEQSRDGANPNAETSTVENAVTESLI